MGTPMRTPNVHEAIILLGILCITVLATATATPQPHQDTTTEDSAWAKKVDSWARSQIASGTQEPDYPAVRELIENLYFKPRPTIPAPSNDTSFLGWIGSRCDGSGIVRPNPLPDVLLDALSSKATMEDLKLTVDQKMCSERVLAISYVACNRRCDKYLDLVYNSCVTNAEAMNDQPYWMATICCAELIVR